MLHKLLTLSVAGALFSLFYGRRARKFGNRSRSDRAFAMNVKLEIALTG